MRKTIVITVIVTILAAFTGAVIWLCPGPNDKVEQSELRTPTVFSTTTDTTTTGTSGTYMYTGNGMVRVD